MMRDDPDWRRSRRKRLAVAAIAAVVTPLIRLLGRSYRWQLEGDERLGALAADGRAPILALWHGRILPAVYALRGRGIVAITSENFDGEWIARVMRRFGYGASRGSTSRGGGRALRQLLRDVRRRPVAFTVDGPRGPARAAQPGAVWLAKATGHPIVPFHIEAARAWTLGSWDRGLVPWPFSRVVVVFGEPLTVARDVDDAGLERARVRLEAALGACERRCHARLGRSAGLARQEDHVPHGREGG